MEERIKECIDEDNINFIQIIARDIEIIRRKNKMIIPSYGIFEDDGLIQLSFKLAKNLIKSSFFNYMKNLLKCKCIYEINLKAYLKMNTYIASKIKAVIFEKEKALEDIRNSFEKEFLEIIKLFLIDEQIPEYIEENKNLINQYFNCFPNLKDNKLLNLVDKLKEDNNSSLLANYMESKLLAEKECGLKRKQ
jgi:hypothetical protein